MAADISVIYRLSVVDRYDISLIGQKNRFGQNRSKSDLGGQNRSKSDLGGQNRTFVDSTSGDFTSGDFRSKPIKEKISGGCVQNDGKRRRIEGQRRRIDGQRRRSEAATLF